MRGTMFFFFAMRGLRAAQYYHELTLDTILVWYDDGAIWYHYGTKRVPYWYQMVPLWYHIVPYGTIWYQMVP